MILHKLGKSLFSIGAMTAVVSLGGYAILSIYQVARFIAGHPSSADSLALPLTGLLAGLFFMAVGWALEDRTRIE